jgi:hypothetical protein
MLADMLSSQFDAAIASPINLEQYRINQKLNYLAVTALLPALINVPTFDRRCAQA